MAAIQTIALTRVYHSKTGVIRQQKKDILALAGLSVLYFVFGHYLYRLIERIVRERGGLEQW